MSGKKDVQTNSTQQEGLSRFRNVKGKPDQIRVASSDNDVKEREFQEMTQPTAVIARRPAVVPIASPFSLQASPL